MDESLVNPHSDLIATPAPGGSDEELDRLVELDRATCLELLATLAVGRIAWPAGPRVMVFPLNFGFDGDDIIVRTASQSICAAVGANPYVSFQGDDTEPAFRTGWTVLVSGPAEEVTDPVQVARLQSLVTPWRGLAGLRLLRIHIEHIEGRQLRTRPGSVESIFIDAYSG